MNSKNLSYNFIKSIFKVNWTIGLVVFLSIYITIPVNTVLEYFFNLCYVSDKSFVKEPSSSLILLAINSILILITLILLFLFARLRNFISISFIALFFSIYLFFYFFNISYDSADYFYQGSYLMNEEFILLMTFINSIVGSILYFVCCKKIYNNKHSTHIVFIGGVLSYLVLNIGGLIRVYQFNYPSALLFICISTLFALLFKYGKKPILRFFEIYLVLNVVLLFYPFVVCFIYKIPYEVMSELWSIKCYSHISSGIIDVYLPERAQNLILFSPYQLTVFPLYFSFNAYIIAEKMREQKTIELKKS